MKDAEDQQLESLFASDPIMDDGFSARVEKRIRREVWVRRLSLPIAVLVGGAIAVKPLAGLLTQLFSVAVALLSNFGTSISGLPTSSLPQLSTVMLGGMLALVFVMITHLLED